MINDEIFNPIQCISRVINFTNQRTETISSTAQHSRANLSYSYFSDMSQRLSARLIRNRQNRNSVEIKAHSHRDANVGNTIIHSGAFPSHRKTLRNRKSLVDSHERRKSRRHSTGTSPLSMSLNARLSPRLNHSLGLSSLNNTLNSSLPDDDDESSSSQSSQGHLGEVQLNGSYKENKGEMSSFISSLLRWLYALSKDGSNFLFY